MKRLLVILIFSVLIACNSKEYTKKSIEKDIKSYSDQLIKNKNAILPEVDTLILKKMATTVNKYIDNYPQDSICASSLYRIGEAYKAAHRPGIAIQYWGRVQREYPESKFAPQALFLQAFTFENEIGDKENAKRYYQQFLERFPSHPFAKDAEQLLQLIDKSPEELLEQLKSN